VGSKNDKLVPLTDREIFNAEYPDYDFLDRPSPYAPGTKMEFGGEQVDVSAPAKKKPSGSKQK
jgi:hypothetical protein